MNWTPAAQITPLGCCGAFFSERLWLVLRIQASHHQNLHGQLAHIQVLASCIETPYNSFWGFTLQHLSALYLPQIWGPFWP